MTTGTTTIPARARGVLRRRRDGLSLVEILVSLAILVVIGAVVVPWTIQWLGGRELDNAEDQLAMQMMMARAAAREEGRPVEVVANGDRGVEARWMQAEDLLDEGADGASGARRGGTDEDELDAIRAQWALLDLPSGVRIQLSETDAGADAEGADAGDEAASLPQTLAIFLPDGTAILAPIFMLRTDGGMARAMRVDRATGRPREVAGASTKPFRSSEDPFRDRLGESDAELEGAVDFEEVADDFESSRDADSTEDDGRDSSKDSRGSARRGAR
jgi:type II secretory pathway pseudopilin PulG